MDLTEEQIQEKKEREIRCMEKLKQLLIEENCRADGSVVISGDKVTSTVVITAYDLPVEEKIQVEEVLPEAKEEIVEGEVTNS